jgi:predicted DNA-binding transcriptional regulator AlpA
MEYIFTLKYRLSPTDSDLDQITERLGAAGCDDALVGIGQPGRIALEFTREADSAEEAVISALEDVKRAVPSATLIEVAPDLVGLTDVAKFTNMTRQNLRKLMVNHAMNFPVPVHEGSASIWHLADVLSWLQAKGGYELQHGLFEVAAVAMQVNLAKEVKFVAPRVRREVRSLVS